MARKATTNAALPPMYAHVFEENCMNYYGTYEGKSEEELLAQIDNDLSSNGNDPTDFVVMFGPIYKLRTKGIQLDKVTGNPSYSVRGLEMR